MPREAGTRACASPNQCTMGRADPDILSANLGTKWGYIGRRHHPCGLRGQGPSASSGSSDVAHQCDFRICRCVFPVTGKWQGSRTLAKSKDGIASSFRRPVGGTDSAEDRPFIPPKLKAPAAWLFFWSAALESLPCPSLHSTSTFRAMCSLPMARFSPQSRPVRRSCPIFGTRRVS